MKIDQAKVRQGIEMLLEGIGADLNDEPYKGTPDRIARFYEEMFGDRDPHIKSFPESYHGGPITFTGHHAYSLCPHHLLPVEFSIDVSYVPIQTVGAEKVAVLGLSKLPRLINQVIFSGGPALQEKMTQDIAMAVAKYADQVHVIVRGEHSCTKIRGVKSSGIMTTEYAYVSEAAKAKMRPQRPLVQPV